MIKLTILKIINFALIGYFIQALSPTWGSLDIVSQVRIVSGLIFMVLLGIVAVVIFRSVWIKNGYAGLDQILVDKEVALFMSHVLSFVMVEIFFFMVLFYNYVPIPQYVFWICAGGFLSPELVQALYSLLEKIKKK